MSSDEESSSSEEEIDFFSYGKQSLDVEELNKEIKDKKEDEDESMSEEEQKIEFEITMEENLGKRKRRDSLTSKKKRKLSKRERIKEIKAERKRKREKEKRDSEVIEMEENKSRPSRRSKRNAQVITIDDDEDEDVFELVQKKIDEDKMKKRILRDKKKKSKVQEMLIRERLNKLQESEKERELERKLREAKRVKYKVKLLSDKDITVEDGNGDISIINKIEITLVVQQTNEEIQCKVEDNKRVDKLLDRVSVRKKWKRERIYALHKGRRIKNKTTFKMLGFTGGERLMINVPDEARRNEVVKHLKLKLQFGKNDFLEEEFLPNGNIGDVIKRVSEIKKIRKNKITVYFDGEKLSPNVSFHDEDMEDGECLDIKVR